MFRGSYLVELKRSLGAIALASLGRAASTSDWLSWTQADYISLGTPTTAKNISGSTIAGALSGQLIPHPGPAANGDYAILRFTAPVTASYDVVGPFYAGDSGSMSGSVVLGGNLALMLAGAAMVGLAARRRRP